MAFGGCRQHYKKDVKDNNVLDFLQSQRDIKIQLGRYSKSFGVTLLLGTIAQPCFTVPKPGMSKFRLVNDHMAGINSLNATIAPEDGSFRPDNLIDLGMLILNFYQEHRRSPSWLFKSDASSAYRLLPCHFWWQAWQATPIDNKFYID